MVYGSGNLVEVSERTTFFPLFTQRAEVKPPSGWKTSRRVEIGAARCNTLTSIRWSVAYDVSSAASVIHASNAACEKFAVNAPVTIFRKPAALKSDRQTIEPLHWGLQLLPDVTD